MATNHLVDDDGQPIKPLYVHRLVDRQTTEMLGLAKGIICDGVVSDAEIVALKQWFKANPDVSSAYPGDQLARRMLTVLEDGVIEEHERAELKEFLLDLVGEPAGLTGTMRDPTRLPLDQPPPTIVFDAHEYVFTGTLASGNRVWAEQQVAERGGTCGKTVTKRTNFLVVGLFASEAWIQSTHGRKIQRAVELRDAGEPIHIVAEEHWLEAIENGA
jgi:NAD-dependent DNA ligase